eukprot:6180254-Pleurochrysis_carterae.AAC.2
MSTAVKSSIDVVSTMLPRWSRRPGCRPRVGLSARRRRWIPDESDLITGPSHPARCVVTKCGILSWRQPA